MTKRVQSTRVRSGAAIRTKESRGPRRQRIEGAVLADRGAGLEGLRIEAYRDEALTDRLAEATTDAMGRFDVEVDVGVAALWMSAKAGGRPDVRTPFLDPWIPRAGRHELFALERPTVPPAIGGAGTIITVLDADGHPPAADSYRIALVERTARTCVVHGEAEVPASGRVLLRLDPERRLTRTQPDLFVRLSSVDGTPIVDARSFELRLPARLATRGSELKRVVTAIEAAGVPVAEVTDDDLAYVAARTGVPPLLARIAREAAKLAARLDVATAATYGWLRAAATGTSGVADGLARARLRNVTPAVADADRDVLTRAVDTARRESALAQRGRFAGAALGAVLERGLPDPALRGQLAADYLARRDRGSLWRDWTDRLGEATVASLRFTTDVARVTDHVDVVRALEAARERGELADATSLAAWSPGRWHEFLIGLGISAPGAFGAVTDDQAAALQLYGDRLALELSLRHPTIALRSKLDEDLTAFPAWVRPVQRFLQARPGYLLEQDPRNVAEPIDHDDPALPGLRAIFRLLRLPASPWHVSTLLTEGFTSARAIARVAPATFLRRIGGGPTAIAGLIDLHDRAVSVATKAVLLRANLGRGQYVNGQPVLGGPAPTAAATRPQALITWDTLFGDADRARCACTTCRSVYSAASYLVSLLETLDAHPKGPPCSAGPSSAGGGLGVDSLADLFVARRRDVHRLLLSCENTNVAVPTIDLVNELLEELVAPGPAPTTCQPIGTQGTAAERRAEPQALNAPAAVRLETATIPWTLPYSIQHHRGLLALEQLGIPLDEAGDLTRDLVLAASGRAPGLVGTPPDVDAAADRLRARNLLGATATEWDILRTPADAPNLALPYWGGLEPGPGEVVAARALMDATGLGFNALFDLMATRFVRGDRAGTSPPVTFVAHGTAAVGTCAVDELDAMGVTWAILDRLHRFVRLMRFTGLTADELDELLLIVGATTETTAELGDAQLVAVAHAVGVCRRAGRAITELLPLFGHVSDIAPLRVARSDERLTSPFEKVFDRSPTVLAAAIHGLAGQGQIDAAATVLAGLAGLDRVDALASVAPVLGPTTVAAAMSSPGDLTFLASSARRIDLLAGLTGFEVEDVLALWRLSGLALLPPLATAGPTLGLSVAIWRFLRFARSAQGWTVAPREVARLCGLASGPRAAAVDLGRSLVDLARAFEALEAELPLRTAPSRDELSALLARVVIPSGTAGRDAPTLTTVLEVVDAAPFAPLTPASIAALEAASGAALDPAVFAALDLPGVPGCSAAVLATGVAAEIGGLATPIGSLQTAIAALLPVLPGTPAPIGPQPTFEERRQQLAAAIDDGVEAAVRVAARTAGLGTERAAAAYRAPVDAVLVNVRAAAVAGTVEDRIVELTAAIALVDQQAATPPSTPARAAAEAVVTAFLERLGDAAERGERALVAAIAAASLKARAHAYGGLRTYLLRLRRDSATIQWLSGRLGLDQDRTAYLVRDLLRHPRDATLPMLAAFTERDGARVQESLVSAVYSNSPAVDAVAVSVDEAGLDLDWQGRPPAPGISASGFVARLGLAGITLATNEVLAVRTSCTLVEVEVTSIATAATATSTPAPAVGWSDVFTAAAAGPINLSLRLGPPGAASGPPRVEVVRKPAGQLAGPVHSDARRGLEEDLTALERASLVARGFAMFGAETWSRLAGAPGASAIDLAGLVGAPAASWLTSYRRLEALRNLRARCDDPTIWIAYLDARRAGTGLPLALWTTVQGLSDLEATARRDLYAQAGHGDVPIDELVLAAGEVVAARADEATLPPAAVIAVGRLGPTPASPAIPPGPLTDAELDGFGLAALRAQEPARRARELLQAVHDPVRLRYRDALVAWLLHREAAVASPQQPRFFDIKSLNQYLLTDTAVTCCDATSRVQFASAAVQAFVEGILDRSIAPVGVDPAYWMGSLEVLDREWTWKRHYRLWEANMNLFLTPENWLEDETRGDETHAFRELREALRQGELTSSAAERALTGYLRRLHELSRLEIVTTVDSKGDCEAIPLGFRRGDLVGTHVIGRTRSLPARYFYRRRLPTPETRWLPWEPLDVDIDGDAFDLVIHGGRLWFFWATFRPGPEQAAELDADAKAAGQNAPKGETPATATVRHAIRLHWIERVHGAWHGRGGAPTPIKVGPLTAADLPASVFRFALRSRTERERLIVHPVWRAETDAPQEPDETVPDGLVELRRLEHPTIRTTWLTTNPSPLAGLLHPEILLQSVDLDDAVKFRWLGFDNKGVIGYVLPFGSTHPGAIQLIPFINRKTGDVVYASDPLEQASLAAPEWLTAPPYMWFKVLPRGPATKYTRSLRRFLLEQLTPPAPAGWAGHNYGTGLPTDYQKPPHGADHEELDDEGGECLIWTTKVADAATKPERVPVWRGDQAFDLGPAGDVTIRAASPPANLAYATSGDLFADGLGYLAPHGGQPLRLPLGGKPREALGDMDRVYRIVMETAHGRSSTSGEPRFVDELREQTREEGGDDQGDKGRLRTFFCERVETVDVDVSLGGGLDVDVGGEIDFHCLEIGIHGLGNAGGLGGGGLGGGGLGGGGLGGGGLGGGGLGGGVVDPLPDGVLFQPAGLHAAITRAHAATMRTGAVGTWLGEAFEEIGRGLELGVGLPPRGGGPIGGPVWPPGGGILGGGLPGTGVVIPDELSFPSDGFDVTLGWDPRQCNLGGLGGHRLTTRLTDLVRRASFLTPSAALPANALTLLGSLTVTTTTKEQWAIRPFHHPFTAGLFGRLAAASVPGLMELAGGQPALPFLDQYDPDDAVVAGAPTWAFPGGWRRGGQLEPLDELDYSDTGAFGDYNWELTYHAPMLIGRRLTQLGRFEDARRWFQLVFAPHAATAADVRSAFRCRPLREAANASAEAILTLLGDPKQSDESLLRQVRRFTNEPFRPHLIARARPVAYAKAAIIAYIDMLIAWGDSLFRTDDRTMIEEARRRYEEAERLLGEVPEVLPPRAAVAPTCYAKLEADGRTGAGVLDPLVEIEGLVQPSGIEAAGAISGGVPGGGSLTLYFCFAGNDRFDTLKATIADRLLKIRACQNLEGIERTLSLYGNKIDPGLIARAVAAGVSPADVFNELNAPLPRFRFKELIQRAKEVCADARGLGQSLLSSLEKKDSESQQQLRAGLDLEALTNLKRTKAKQLEEAQRAQEAADAAKAPVETRKTFYSTREFMNADERTATDVTWAAMGVRAGAAVAGVIAQALTPVPDMEQWAHAQLIASGTSTGMGLGGGSKAAYAFQVVQQAATLAADILGTSAANAREQGAYRRRQDDWNHQVELAGKELTSLEKQAAAAAVRAAIAQVEVENHEAQIGHAQATQEFLRSKFTNAELYGWMSSRLAGLYYEQFRLAYDTLLQAQRAWQYELGTDERLVMGSPWEPGKKGLLAADELMGRIHQLEISFDQKKPYDHAKSPDIRLSGIAPRALIQLRNTGACEFEIPEAYFDSIEPGGCFRRWKGMAVTIPCVRGPSAVLDGRLTLLAHSRRAQPGRKPAVAPDPDDADALLKGVDGELSVEVGGRDYIELTHGNRDLGLPETAGQEGWRLPFEGTGAISRWRLELPLETNTFDRRSLTDVVLHAVYTARNGSPQDRAAARAAAHEWPKEILIDVAALFPEEWHAFTTSGTLALAIADLTSRTRRAGHSQRKIVELRASIHMTTPARSIKLEPIGAAGLTWRRSHERDAMEGALPLDAASGRCGLTVTARDAAAVDAICFMLTTASR